MVSSLPLKIMNLRCGYENGNIRGLPPATGHSLQPG
jgi:hypothetical protein